MGQRLLRHIVRCKYRLRTINILGILEYFCSFTVCIVLVMEMLVESGPNISDRQGSGASRVLRKVKKPLIEKKRRDRINQSLITLKHLLLDNIKRHGGTQTSKLDKADILEMTVNTLRMVSRGSSTITMSSKVHYGVGYQACGQETLRYLNENNLHCDPAFQALAGHLRQIPPASGTVRENPEDSVRPLRIHIPQIREYAHLQTSPTLPHDAPSSQLLCDHLYADGEDATYQCDIDARGSNNVEESTEKLREDEICCGRSRSPGQGETDIWRPW